jgi:hypothetical protein
MLLPGGAVKPSNMADKGSRYGSRLPIAQFDPPAMQNELALLVPMAITRWARLGGRGFEPRQGSLIFARAVVSRE